MFFRKHKIDELDLRISRQDLLARSRILIIDDERPELIDDLNRAGFSVDYKDDVTRQQMSAIDWTIYDLVILDFGNVGADIGQEQGLSLMKLIKRLSPSTLVLAYTSKSLGTEYADFYLMADGMLRKDSGIGETMERIEEELEKARGIHNLWKGLLHIAKVAPGSKEDIEWQDYYVRKVKKRQPTAFRDKLVRIVASERGQDIGILILDKLVDLGIKGYLGG